MASNDQKTLEQIRKTGHIVVNYVCPTCNGTRHTLAVRSYCRRCGRRYMQAELEAADDPKYQPCGDVWEYFTEEDTCADCEGNGTIDTIMSLREFGLLVGDFFKDQLP